MYKIKPQPTNFNLITIIRTKINKLVTHSDLYVNDKFVCNAFENSKYLIPTGLFDATFYNSPKNKSKVILLIVPNRAYIEIHSANFYYQIKGCIAPVNLVSITGGLFSKDALKLVFDSLNSKLVTKVQVLEFTKVA